MDRAELERLDRESLVARAQASGIRRARVLTRPELIDELLRLDPAMDAVQLKRTRGFFGLARDLLTRVVERGLHLPDAAERLRSALGDPLPHVARPEPQAVPTVTLAEIYAAQGHKQRAIDTLKRVLDVEPEHGAARALLGKLEATDYVAPEPPLPPEPDERPDEGADVEPASERPSGHAVVAAEPSSSRVTAERLDTTECIAIPLGGDGYYVWWRLSAEATRAIVERLEAGAFVVRALVIVPSWDGPETETRDVRVDPDAGELIFHGLPPHAVVRVAIGQLSPGAPSFIPLAHSPLLETTTSSGVLRWTLEGSTAIALDDPSAASIVRAVEGAARVSRLSR